MRPRNLSPWGTSKRFQRRLETARILSSSCNRPGWLPTLTGALHCPCSLESLQCSPWPHILPPLPASITCQPAGGILEKLGYACVLRAFAWGTPSKVWLFLQSRPQASRSSPQRFHPMVLSHCNHGPCRPRPRGLAPIVLPHYDPYCPLNHALD